MTKHYKIGIVLTDNFTADDYKDFIKAEYDNLKPKPNHSSARESSNQTKNKPTG